MTGLQEFVAIVQAGSLSAAARDMGLPRPTLARRLARLEERLGVRLLHRTTRRQTLTAEGQLLFERAEHLVRGLVDAQEAVRRLDGTPRGRLRVAVPSEMPHEVVVDWVRDFLDAYHEVQLDWVATDDEVDLLADFDVAFRSDADVQPSLVVRTLVRNRRVVVASPAWLADNPLDLTRVVRTPGERAWPLRAGGTVPVSGRFTANQQGMRAQAALRGVGPALVTDRIVRDELADGRLVHVLPHVGADERVCLVYADREFLDPKIRAFIDLMVDRVVQRAGVAH